jgi:ETC complex I subunit conserved region
MQVRIYKPAKNAMQSGRSGQAGHWLLEYAAATPRGRDPLTGWTGADDTLEQVRIPFDTKDAALAFVAEQGWECDDRPDPRARRIKPSSYLDNFRYRAPGA